MTQTGIVVLKHAMVNQLMGLKNMDLVGNSKKKGTKFIGFNHKQFYKAFASKTKLLGKNQQW